MSSVSSTGWFRRSARSLGLQVFTDAYTFSPQHQFSAVNKRRSQERAVPVRDPHKASNPFVEGGESGEPVLVAGHRG
jgi:hypothetical protein